MLAAMLLPYCCYAAPMLLLTRNTEIAEERMLLVGLAWPGGTNTALANTASLCEKSGTQGKQI